MRSATSFFLGGSATLAIAVLALVAHGRRNADQKLRLAEAALGGWLASPSPESRRLLQERLKRARRASLLDHRPDCLSGLVFGLTRVGPRCRQESVSGVSLAHCLLWHRRFEAAKRQYLTQLSGRCRPYVNGLLARLEKSIRQRVREARP